MTIVYQREPQGRTVAEALPLFEAHYSEIARYKSIPLDIDFAFYQQIEDAGMLRVFSARAEDRLIAYVIYVVRSHPHYKTTIFANQDVLFIHPDYRRSLVFHRLMKTAAESLRAEGVVVEVQHVKVYADFGPALLRMGYEKVEDIYMRRLDAA